MNNKNNIYKYENKITKKIRSKRNIYRLFYKNKNNNKCIGKYFRKKYKTRKLFVEIYDYIQNNHYNKFFKFNLKRIYKLEVIIAEVYHMLVNSISYANHIGEINEKSLNKYVLFFSRNDVFKIVHKKILDDYIKNNQNKIKVLAIDSCNATNKNCINEINYNGQFKNYDNATKNKIINRFNLTKKCKHPKRKLKKKEYTKYNTSLILGKNKQYNNKKSIKISAITNDYAIPIDVKIYNGAIYDSVIGKDHINSLDKMNNKTYLLADKGYDSEKMINECINKNMIPIIPLNIRNTKDKNKILLRTLSESHKKIYKKRNRVEHFFAILKRYKRIDHVYERYISTYESFLYLALIDIIINYKN